MDKIMELLFSVAALLFVMAFPSAIAQNNSSKDFCDDDAYEIYRNDIPTLTDFKAAAEALASDPSAYTFVDEHRFKVEGGNYYEALLTGVADKGEVVLFNVGTGKAVDCNLASQLDFIEVEEEKCVKELDWRTKIACLSALAHYEGFVYVKGVGNASLETEVLQKSGYSATSKQFNAAGSEGVVGQLSSSDSVEDQNGNLIFAKIDLSVAAEGDSVVDANTFTEATENGYIVYGTVSVTTTYEGGKKGYKPKIDIKIDHDITKGTGTFVPLGELVQESDDKGGEIDAGVSNEKGGKEIEGGQKGNGVQKNGDNSKGNGVQQVKSRGGGQKRNGRGKNKRNKKDRKSRKGKKRRQRGAKKLRGGGK